MVKKDMPKYVLSEAKIVGDYRYYLVRTWPTTVSELKSVVFIMLNPSTADGDVDDATIRKCVMFAKRWGYTAVYVVNLFAVRCTDPKMLPTFVDPIGPDNDAWIEHFCSQDCLVVAAWGADPFAVERSKQVLKKLTREVCCLGTTKSGQPKHPLYLPKSTALITFKNPFRCLNESLIQTGIC